jgi:phage gp36-like protein
MAYLQKDDLATHLYGENIDEITRNSDLLVTIAINAAISEAKSYLNKYNLDLLFGDPPTPADENLRNKVKDLACWHLVSLANPNINYEVFRDRYEKSLRWFEFVMKGQMDPQGWPYKEDDADTPYNEGGSISWTSETKRTTNF